ncbi:MAG: 30S ribosomal protein S9 [Candidatus Melainabacteria bacterium]|jgi:small subunit ribosomal protein S9|nr:30S ribosomal protein S9 [Candidatus Melainabacteria bacterium]
MKKSQENQIVTGKRKRAIARVRLKSGEGKIVVNGKHSFDEYFGSRESLKKRFLAPLEMTGNLDKLDIFVNLKGGGKVGQADALASAVAKALSTHKDGNRTVLKAAGMLTRDSRIKESKKYGRKKARKKFQFSKR